MICYIKLKQISGNFNGRHAKINIKHASEIPSCCCCRSCCLFIMWHAKPQATYRHIITRQAGRRQRAGMDGESAGGCTEKTLRHWHRCFLSCSACFVFTLICFFFKCQGLCAISVNMRRAEAPRQLHDVLAAQPF